MAAPIKGQPVSGTTLVVTPDGRYYNTVTGQYVTVGNDGVGKMIQAKTGLKPNANKTSGIPAQGDDGKLTFPSWYKSPTSQLTGGTDVKTNAGPQTLDVKGLQNFLIRKGYNLAADGKLGPITKSALADYLDPAHVGGTLGSALTGTRITGKRDPKHWNQLFGANKDAPVKPQSQTLDQSGNTKDLSSTSTAPPDITNQVQNVDYTSALKGMPTAGHEDPNAAATYGAKLFDPSQADAMAGLQYDPQISDQNKLLTQLPRDKAQAIADIKNWMAQVTGSQTTAAGRDAAISQAGQSSIGDAIKSIIGSVGGAANAGSANIGATGAAAEGTLAALGANQDQYQQDLKPILGLEREGQLSSADAKFEATKQALLQKLAGLHGARGQAVADNNLKLQEANNGILDNRAAFRTHALEYNNGQDQQAFNNKLALNTAITNSILANARVIGAGGKPAPGTFASSSAGTRQKFAGALQSALLGSDGKPLPGMTRAKAMAIAQKMVPIYFPNGGIPNGTGLISGVIANAGLTQ